METLNHYSIPLEGLKDGMHQFEYRIDEDFFKHFEQSPIQEGNFNLMLYFDKRPDLLVLTFDFKGSFSTSCDRCLEGIKLPVQSSDQLLVKYALEPSEDAEVIYITRGTQLLNVAKFIYEFICLAIPIVKTYDCKADEHPPCNMDVLAVLYQNKVEEEKEETTNPVWEALKNFKKDTGLSDTAGSEN